MIQLPSLPQYLLESSLCLLVFYFLYKAFFQRNTFFQANRFYLLSGAIFSFIIPALHFTWQQEEVQFFAPMMNGSEIIVFGFNESLQQAPIPYLTLGQLILLVYTLGVIFFSIRLLRRLYHLYKITQHDSTENQEGISTFYTDLQDTSSFFTWLFFNPRHHHEDAKLIIEHELVHIRQWHSVDVIVMEILTIINWFNPIVHLYNRSLRETHEFIADKIVASLADSKYHYAKLLVNEVSKSINPALSNTFASLIKKRLLMLSTQNSKKRKGLYYFMILPTLMLLMILFSFNIADPVSGLEELSEKIEKLVEKEISTMDMNTKTPDVNPIANNVSVNIIDEEKLAKEKKSDLSKFEEDVFFLKKQDGYYLHINKLENYSGNKISLYDRWGMNRFEEVNYNNHWKADALEDAMYYYVLEVNNMKLKGYARKGEVSNAQVIQKDTLPPPPLPNDEIFMIVEYMPHFPGCEDIADKDERKKCSDGKIISFINNNIKYPAIARENGIEGTAVIRFVVEKDGSITFDSDEANVILRDPGGGCGKEALKVVKKMPTWKPGKQRNQPVKVQFTLPIKFQLAD